MDEDYEATKAKEKEAMDAAWALPFDVAYWAFIRVAVEGVNEYPGSQTVQDVAKRHLERVA